MLQPLHVVDPVVQVSKAGHMSSIITLALEVQDDDPDARLWQDWLLNAPREVSRVRFARLAEGPRISSPLTFPLALCLHGTPATEAVKLEASIKINPYIKQESGLKQQRAIKREAF